MTLELRAPGGFDRPPRILRIEPNVIPIPQERRIDRELHPAARLAGLEFRSRNTRSAVRPGRACRSTVEVAERRRFRYLAETRAPRPTAVPVIAPTSLIPSPGVSPSAMASMGRCPPPAPRFSSATRSATERPATSPRNRKWSVPGFAGLRGQSRSDRGRRRPVGWFEQRREARRRRPRMHS